MIMIYVLLREGGIGVIRSAGSSGTKGKSQSLEYLVIFGTVMPNTISPHLIRFPLFQNFLVTHFPLSFPGLDMSKQTDRVQVKATSYNTAEL